MNAFAAVILFVAVATANPIGYDYAEHDVHAVHVNPAAHIPSGSIGVSADGVVIAGPAGSIKTDNGLHGLGAGAIVAGPSGDVHTQGGHAELTGPGYEHEDVHEVHGAVIAAPVAAPAVVFDAPAVVAASVGQFGVIAGPAAHAAVVGPSAHARIVGPSFHATIVGPSSHGTIAGATSHTVLAAPVAHHAIVAVPAAHYGYVASPFVTDSWAHDAGVLDYGHGGVYAEHGLLAGGVHGHHGW